MGQHSVRKLNIQLFGLALLLLTVITWGVLNADRDRRVDAALLKQTNGIAEKLFLDLDARIKSTQRMAKRWEYAGRMDPRGFEQDAEAYLRDLPGFRAISVIDPSFVARQVVPSENSRALGKNIADISDDRRRALELARDTRQNTLTDPIQLVDGSGVGFIYFTPIYQQSEFLGVLGTVFHVNSWLGSLFNLENRMLREVDHLKITLNGTPIFVGDAFAQSEQPTVMSRPVSIFSQPLVVYAKQHAAFVASHKTYLPELITGFIGFLSLASLILMINVQRLKDARVASLQQQSVLQKTNKELTNEVQFRQAAEAKAKEADDAKSRFLAVMSHEVRTPLNAIMGMFELIERANVPARQKKQAQSGYRAAHRLFDELTKVLDVSRIDAGAISINPGLVATDVAFEDWTAQLAAMITSSGKNLDIVTHLNSNVPPTLWIDFDRTTQVLNNLINNAVKFTAVGQIELRLNVHPETRHLELSVRDTGQGIAADQIAPAFARFYQLKGGLNRSAQGSGLGLSICKDLAVMMDGDITVTSQVGLGSTFTLHLRNYVPQKMKQTNADAA